MLGRMADGVLITGVYGSGKSTVAAEVADQLERQQVAYAALDLDWLTWFEVPGLDHDTFIQNPDGTRTLDDTDFMVISVRPGAVIFVSPSA